MAVISIHCLQELAVWVAVSGGTLEVIVAFIFISAKYSASLKLNSGGPKPKLGDAERDNLKQMIAEKDAWTLREVRELIKQKFDVQYSDMQV